MIEVSIDSIRVSLITHHRVVVLKEQKSERYLPIWIGPFEADAITIQLQGVQVQRPMTHDLLKSLIDHVDARVAHILVSALKDDTYFAQISVDLDGRRVEVDSRPSDALALAVRAGVPIYVSEEVMERAGVIPGQEKEGSEPLGEGPATREGAAPLTKEEGDKLSAFREFVEGLDIEDLGEDDK